MATIQKRRGKNGSVTFRAQVRLRGSPPESATFENKTAAKHWVTSTEAAIREKRHFRSTASKKHTLGELIEQYMEQWLPQKKIDSAATQKPQLIWWREELGHMLLCDLTSGTFVEARGRLSRRLVRKTTPEGEVVRTRISSGTINRYFAAISHVLSVAVHELGWLHENPVRSVKKLKEPRGRVRFLSPEELKRLVDACRAERNRFLFPFVLIALSTGMRKNEVLGLKWADFDAKARHIVLHDSKNGERRSVPVPPNVCVTLGILRKEAELHLAKTTLMDVQYIFPGRKAGGRLDIRQPWERAVKAASIEDFRIHDLRHTAASYLAMSGSGLLEIAHVLGHKSLDMVKRYAHLSPQHTAKALQNLSDALAIGE